MQIAVPTDSRVAVSRDNNGLVLTIAIGASADAGEHMELEKTNGASKANGGTQPRAERKARSSRTKSGERLSEILKDIRVMDDPKVENWLRGRIRKLSRPSSRDKAVSALDLKLTGLRAGAGNNEPESVEHRKEDRTPDPF